MPQSARWRGGGVGCQSDSFTLGSGGAGSYSLTKTAAANYTSSDRTAHNYTSQQQHSAVSGAAESDTSDSADTSTETVQLTETGSDGLTLDKTGSDSYALSDVGTVTLVAPLGLDTFAVDGVAPDSFTLTQDRQETFALNEQSVYTSSSLRDTSEASGRLSVQTVSATQSGDDSYNLARSGAEAYGLEQDGSDSFLSVETIGGVAGTDSAADSFNLDQTGGDTFQLTAGGENSFTRQELQVTTSGSSSVDSQMLTQTSTSSFALTKLGADCFQLLDQGGDSNSAGADIFGLSKTGGDTFLYSESGSHSSTLSENQNDTSGTFQTDGTTFDETTNQSTSLTKTGSDLFAFAETGAATITTGGTETFALTKSSLQSSTLDENNGDSGGNFAENAQTFNEDNSATFVLNETRSDGTSTSESTYDTGGVRFSGSLGNYSLTEPASTAHVTTTDPRAALPDALPLARVNIPAPVQGVPLGRASAPVTDMPMSLGQNPAPDLSAPRTLPAMQAETRGLTDLLYRGEDVQMSDALYRGEDAQVQLLAAGPNDGGNKAPAAAPLTAEQHKELDAFRKNLAESKKGPQVTPEELRRFNQRVQKAAQEAERQSRITGKPVAPDLSKITPPGKNWVMPHQLAQKLSPAVLEYLRENGTRDEKMLALRELLDRTNAELAQLEDMRRRLAEAQEAADFGVNGEQILAEALAAKINERLQVLAGRMLQNQQNPSGIKSPSDALSFAGGVVTGFFVNGLWGTVTGAFQLAYLSSRYNPMTAPAMLSFEYGGEYLFGWKNAYKQDQETLDKASALTKRLYQFMANGGAGVFMAASNGDAVGVAARLESLPPEEKLVLLATLNLFVELGIHALEMGPHERGVIFGMILYEVAEAVGTAGVAKLAKTGKLAELLGKIPGLKKAAGGAKIDKAVADLAKTLEGGEKAFEDLVKAERLPAKKALTPTKAFEEIDEFRRLGKGLEPLGPKVPVKGDGLGTVALIENDGQRFFGVNSSILSDASKDLGREVFKTMQQRGLLKGATAYGQGAAQVLTHGEAHALMRMWKKLGTKMPAAVTIYVDRYTCSICQNYLGEVAKALGVKTLKVITKSGETIPIPIP